MQQVKLKSLKRAVLAGLVTAAFLPALAVATPTAFKVSGQWDQGFLGGGGTFSGMMSVDTVAGTIKSMDVMFPDFPTLPAFDTILSSAASTNGLWLVGLGDGRMDPFGSPEQVSFSFTTTRRDAFGFGSLMGFGGGTIVGGGSGILDTGTPITILQDFTGSISPAVAGVPEPAAWGMFGLGTLLIGGFAALRRRYDVT
ncbi:MAG: PEP-CTERM sorting domain-containing protein [Rhodanobacteraceae bacterium]